MMANVWEDEWSHGGHAKSLLGGCEGEVFEAASLSSILP